MSEKTTDAYATEIAKRICKGFDLYLGADTLAVLALEIRDAVKAAIGQEREACAKIADRECEGALDDDYETAAKTIAAAIRARG